MAYSIVSSQTTTAGAASGTSASITYPATPTQGNLLLVFFAQRTTSATLSTTSSGYTLLGNWINPGDTPNCLLWKVAGASEPTTVSVSSTGSGKWGIVATEWSGPSASPFEGDAVNSGSNTTTSSVGPSYTTTNANDLIIATLAGDASMTVNSVSNGFSLIAQISGGGGSGASQCVAAMASFNPSAASTAYSTTWTLSATVFSHCAEFAFISAALATAPRPILKVNQSIKRAASY